MEHAGAYLQILNDVVGALRASVGPGYALQALGLAHPLAPPGGVNEFDSEVRLHAYIENSRSESKDSLRDTAIHAIDAAYKFLNARRSERLRQARITFNAAMTLVLLGTIILLGGVVLLFLQRTTTGILSAAVGAVSNISSALLFRLNRDANDRLDKVEVGIETLEAASRKLALLSPSPDRP